MFTVTRETWRGAEIEQTRGAGWRYGLWRATPDAEVFRSESVSGPDALLVFPEHPVRVHEAGRPAFVANRHVAILREPHARYRLEALVPAGDACLWIALDEPWADVLRHARPGRYLVPATAALARHATLRLRADDDLETADGISAIVQATLEAAVPSLGDVRPVVDAAEQILATRYAEPLTLQALARTVGCSPWHLARAFRAELGTSVHQYRDQLRLREALFRLRDPRIDLTELALDLGYSSHSHLTDRFRTAYGMPPSAVRDAPRSRLRRVARLR